MILESIPMPVMPSRILELERTLVCLKEFGAPLVMNVQGTCQPAGFADDIGLYYFAPLLALKTGWSALQATRFLFLSMLLLGFLGGVAGCLALFRRPGARVASVVALGLLAVFAYVVSDVYVTPVFLVSGLAPLFLYAVEKNRAGGLLTIAALGGVLGGYGNLIRSHAGTGFWILAGVALLLARGVSGKTRLAVLGVFLLSAALPVWHFRHLEGRRDAFLLKTDAAYKPEAMSHPFWHSLYIGFGYLPNARGILYDDMCAAAKVESTRPGTPYCSKEYEDVLRVATWEVVRDDPGFALRTLGAKAVRVAGWAILSVHLGWFFLLRAFPGWRRVLPFLAAGGFLALPGLLVMPFGSYLSGMVAVAVVFGVFLVGWGTAEKDSPGGFGRRGVGAP